jgi:hypothetical protein
MIVHLPLFFMSAPLISEGSDAHNVLKHAAMRSKWHVTTFWDDHVFEHYVIRARSLHATEVANRLQHS